jgi:glycosyltransferase involved in cell wall biosynthesis
MDKKLKVLMITGVYFPEYNGAVRQCRQLILALQQKIYFEILCGTNHIKEAGQKFTDNITITKIFLNRKFTFQYLFQYLNFYKVLIFKLKIFDIVHIHGFSVRNALIILICLFFKKRIILKLTSLGHDDPESIKVKSKILWYLYKKCDIFIGISPAFLLSFDRVGLPENKQRLIPNGVDLNVFKPIPILNKYRLKEDYGYSIDDKIILFVGHFSPEKNPYFIYQSWINFFQINNNAKLILIGATSNHFEVDESIYKNINDDLIRRGLAESVRFVNETNCVQEYMQISDVFLMASEREGLPNVLLEAMSCGLPCIVKSLPGVTDWLIEDRETGMVFEKNDPIMVANMIELIINDQSCRENITKKSIEYIKFKFSFENTSDNIFTIYKELS